MTGDDGRVKVDNFTFTSGTFDVEGCDFCGEAVDSARRGGAFWWGLGPHTFVYLRFVGAVAEVVETCRISKNHFDV